MTQPKYDWNQYFCSASLALGYFNNLLTARGDISIPVSSIGNHDSLLIAGDSHQVTGHSHHVFSSSLVIVINAVTRTLKPDVVNCSANLTASCCSLLEIAMQNGKPHCIYQISKEPMVNLKVRRSDALTFEHPVARLAMQVLMNSKENHFWSTNKANSNYLIKGDRKA